MMSGAEKLGERLRIEVEVEEFSELLASLRHLQYGDAQRKSYFGIPELDALLQSPASSGGSTTAQPPSAHQPPTHQNEPSDDLWTAIPSLAPIARPLSGNPKSRPSFPILELISPPTTHTSSGSGKTSLIYLTTAHAILPSTLCGTSLHGQAAAVILIDPFSRFDARRLAEVCTSLALSKISDRSRIVEWKDEIKEAVREALQHVHVFQPRSWDEMLAVLDGLEEYLFDGSKHGSTMRRVHSIVVEDVDAFYWDIRASSTSTSTSTSTSASASASPLATASTNLTTHLLRLSTRFSTSIILTSHSSTPSPSAFCAPLPLRTSWPPNTFVTRLAVRRVEVLRFVAGISVEEAERERGQRWDVVQRGRFECWKIGSASASAGESGKEIKGFVFRVGVGVEVERDEGQRSTL